MLALKCRVTLICLAHIFVYLSILSFSVLRMENPSSPRSSVRFLVFRNSLRKFKIEILRVKVALYFVRQNGSALLLNVLLTLQLLVVPLRWPLCGVLSVFTSKWFLPHQLQPFRQNLSFWNLYMQVARWDLRHWKLSLWVWLSHTLLQVIDLGATSLHNSCRYPVSIKRVMMMLIQWRRVSIGIGIFLHLIILLRINCYRFLVIILPSRIKLNEMVFNFYFWRRDFVTFIIIILNRIFVIKSSLWPLLIVILILKMNILLLATQKYIVGLSLRNRLVHNDIKLFIFAQAL